MIGLRVLFLSEGTLVEGSLGMLGKVCEEWWVVGERRRAETEVETMAVGYPLGG